MTHSIGFGSRKLAQIERNRVTAQAFTVELPFPLSVNNLFLNARGRIKTPEYRQWSKDAAMLLMAQRARCAVGPVEISVTLADKKGRRDLDNFAFKCVLDCLVENGIIDGDHNKVVRKLTAQWGDVVGAIVEITPAIPATQSRSPKPPHKEAAE